MQLINIVATCVVGMILAGSVYAADVPVEINVASDKWLGKEVTVYAMDRQGNPERDAIQKTSTILTNDGKAKLNLSVRQDLVLFFVIQFQGQLPRDALSTNCRISNRSLRFDYADSFTRPNDFTIKGLQPTCEFSATHR